MKPSMRVLHAPWTSRALTGPATAAASATKVKWQVPGLRSFHQSFQYGSAAARLQRAFRSNQERLMNDIHTTAAFGSGQKWGGGGTEVGMRRLSLSDSDKQVRDWFDTTAKSLGCEVRVDSMGNQFAIRPGMTNGDPIFAGSHLDTQPTGGRYDGILGVLAGIELLRTLNDNGVQTHRPVGVVNWTNEEGARFPISMCSSGVWAECVDEARAHATRSVIPSGDTATMKSELERIGYLGEIPCSYRETPMAAHFELHIEQAPLLEAERRRIGIVQGVQGYKWYNITVNGQESHTGATAFRYRADPLLASSKMIVASHKIAARHNALASTGILTLEPGSVNTVPGVVRFSLDIRAPLDETVEAVEKECRSTFERIASGVHVDDVGPGCVDSIRQCAVDWQTEFQSAATHFNNECIECIEEAGRDLCAPGSAAMREGNSVGDWGKLMTSGAGHDSVYTNKRCPSAMIFVPCKDGISHNPKEFASPEACADGANVLLGAVLRYDRLLADKASMQQT